MPKYAKTSKIRQARKSSHSMLTRTKKKMQKKDRLMQDIRQFDISQLQYTPLHPRLLPPKPEKPSGKNGYFYWDDLTGNPAGYTFVDTDAQDRYDSFAHDECAYPELRH